MKSIITLIATLLFAFNSPAQTSSANWNKFQVKLAALEEKYNTYYPAKAYQETEVVLNDILSALEHSDLSVAEQKEYASNISMIKANVYYNLACIRSLRHQKKQAIADFGKAIDWGYTGYQHAKTDSDLDNIRTDKKFIAFLNRIKQYDMLHILQQSGNYEKGRSDTLPAFVYQTADNHNLKEVRKYFNLDSIAGNGDEVSKLINLMLFVTRSIKYDGSNWALCEFDAIDLYNYHKTTGKGINCRHKAMVLNEIYLAMGFKSRYVTCMPKDQDDPDCHVINVVYSEKLKKWVWMDASHGIYVSDEHHNLLSIEEVRERLKNNLVLKLNKETGKTKEWYLDYYMAKNLYWIQCTNLSQFNTESRYRADEKDLQYIALTPVTYKQDNRYLNGNTITHDPAYFWQAPEK
ncbi:hypothetical protein DBR32_10625 [Taibaiella sp. KBW10]|uniref:TPR end-of-group domain-containing protein n=1 Tax=Taibaiella sp. KBW10 TaxID=2153357 RepID=UPI000F5A45B7|nr:transglutaminase domain-containing protein [Taibaiella sp. KBW10]RQO31149.1 hypothetical protein DBR32_10625 [Taibaiella sp. KBW10]